MSRRQDDRVCGNCRHFDAIAAYVEASLPGLVTLSSGHAAVRAQDGLCAVHDRYLGAYHACDAHAASVTR